MMTFLLLNALAVAIAILVARSALAGAGAAEFALGALCAYLVAIHSTVLVSGLAGGLTSRGAGIVIALGLLTVAWVTYRGQRRRRGPAGWLAHRDDPRPRRPTADAPASDAATPGKVRPTPAVQAATLSAWDIYLVFAAVAAGALWAWPHLWEATRLWIWDDYTYHMVYPALWLREGAIGAVPPWHAFTMQAWYPLGASVVAAWFMLPFRGVRAEALAWVSLTGPLYAGIVACGAAALLARLGCRPGAWAVSATLLFTSHRIGVMASSFSDADLATAAALFAAFAFAVPRREADNPRARRADAWFAALSSGIALGIKVSAVVPALVVLAMVLARALSEMPRLPRPVDRLVARARRVVATSSIFAAAWAVIAAYWYARNLIRTGNPLYPAAFLVWPGTTFPDTTLREYSRHYGFARALGDALAVYLDWPRFHAITAAAALLGLAAWLLWKRSAATRPQAYFALGALAITAAVLIALPGTPYSAGNAMTFRSGFVHWDSMRYVALLPILGWVATGFLLDSASGGPAIAGRARRWRTGPAGGRWGAAVAAAITSLALLTSAHPLLRRPAFAIALAVAATIASAVARSGIALPAASQSQTGGEAGGHVPRAPEVTEVPTSRLAVCAGAIALVLAALVLWRHDAKSAVTAAAIHRERLFGGAAATLDAQPAGLRVAVFGDQWVYPSFGAHGQLTPIRLTGDGRVAATPVGDAMQPGPLTEEPRAFLDNLKAAGIDLVVIIHLPHPGRSPERPAQEAALQNGAGARLVYRSDAVTIWSIGGPRAR